MKIWLQSNKEILFEVGYARVFSSQPVYLYINKRLKIKEIDIISFAHALSKEYPQNFIAYYSEKIVYWHELRRLVETVLRMKIWILRNSFCVLFEIGWKHYAAVNFGACPFHHWSIKRKKIKRNNISSSVYRYYTYDFPTDFLDFSWTGEVVYYHELYRLLFLTENESLDII